MYFVQVYLGFIIRWFYHFIMIYFSQLLLYHPHRRNCLFFNILFDSNIWQNIAAIASHWFRSLFIDWVILLTPRCPMNLSLHPAYWINQLCLQLHYQYLLPSFLILILLIHNFHHLVLHALCWLNGHHEVQLLFRIVVGWFVLILCIVWHISPFIKNLIRFWSIYEIDSG